LSSGRAPIVQLAREFFDRQAGQAVDQAGIMYQQATRFPSHEHAVSQLVDHADNIAGASVLDELRRNLAAEQLLPREQPNPSLTLSKIKSFDVR